MSMVFIISHLCLSVVTFELYWGTTLCVFLVTCFLPILHYVSKTQLRCCVLLVLMFVVDNSACSWWVFGVFPVLCCCCTVWSSFAEGSVSGLHAKWWDCWVMDQPVFSLTAYCRVALQSSCSSLYIHEYMYQFLVAPHPCPWFILSDFVSFTSLVDVSLYVIVALIWISFIIDVKQFIDRICFVFCEVPVVYFLSSCAFLKLFCVWITILFHCMLWIFFCNWWFICCLVISWN